MSVTGIVLSGGKSSRMGREKGLSLLNNKPLIEYSIEALNPVCDQIIIGTNIPDYNYLGYPIVSDQYEGVGPAAGIYSCLEASNTRDNIVLSCDIPLISSQLVQYILSNKKDFQTVIPLHNNYPEPLCAYYRKDISSKLKNGIENRIYKIQRLIKTSNCNFLNIDKGNDWYFDQMFANINTQEDLAVIEKYLVQTNK